LLLTPLVVLIILLIFRPEVRTDIPTLTFDNGASVFIEIADTEKERRQGLSERVSLSVGYGLLFIHETRETPSYWMKDMFFPIDIIWIDDGEVIGLTQNAEPENPARTFYTPPSPVTHVLEVNAGFIEQRGISVGNTIDIKVPNE